MPLSDSVKPVVRSLAETVLVVETQGGDPPAPGDVEFLTEQLAIKLDQMPSYMAVGMVACTALFDLSALPLTGRTFRRLPPERRLARLRAWRASPLPFLPDFVDFYEKMGTFIYWSRVEEREHGATGATARAS